MRVCGIITSYWPESFDVRLQSQKVKGAEVLANSGIILAEQIARVSETLDAL